ncbi:MAG: PD-(D/E)XK nuclease family protein [Eubacterium sp.]|nr:PD-(D/E)XK nuclease family protein [Eubacterium sp.]
MSLQFVTGRSGAGKSHTVFKQVIRESMNHPDRQYIILVPEQFTLQTQKDIVRLHPRRGILNIDVLSFNRLAYRVFEEVGGNDRTLLEETGKSLIIRKVIEDRKDQLKILGRDLDKTGAIAEMKSLISELMQYRIQPDDLEKWAAGDERRQMLSLKLEDIRVIYQGFLDYIEGHFLTAEEVPEALCRVIGRSKLVKNSTIVLDGFTGFTPVQHQVLRELMVLADRLIVTITIDDSESLYAKGRPYTLFAMSRTMAQKLLELARETKTEILPVIQVEEAGQSRFAGHKDLLFLERNIFRTSRAVFSYPKNESATLAIEEDLPSTKKNLSHDQTGVSQDLAKYRSIHISEADNPYREVLNIAGRINMLVRERGFRYKDFAIVTGDLESYGRAAESVFAREEIPYFLDRKQPIMKNPLVEYICSAIDMVEQNFSYRSVFRFLRSGLSDFTGDQIDRMENYVLALGIHGWKKYQEPWIRASRTIDVEELPGLNQLREVFVSRVRAFTEGMRERRSTTSRKCRILYGFLTDRRIPAKLEQLSKSYEEAGYPAKAREYGGIWAVVMMLLEKLEAVLGEERTRRSDFLEILEAGFQECSIGLIPPGEDQVLIGDIERTRLKEIKVLFFAGVNEGIVPRSAANVGFLSEADREYLEKQKIELSPTAREDMYRQRFYLYLAMTKPSEELCLSYARTGSDAKSLLPSYLIGLLRRMFPELEPEEAGILETDEGRNQAILDLLQTLGDAKLPAAGMEVLRDRASDPTGRREVKRLLQAAALSNRESTIGRPLAQKLYGSEIYMSATRLESFAACPFCHFLDFGLGLTERETYQLDLRDTGNILHSALETYAKILDEKGIAWQKVTEEEQIRVADEALNQVSGDYNNTILASSSRNSYQLTRMRELLHRSVWALTEQVRHGIFQPLFFEKKFTGGLLASRFELKGGSRLYVHGRIDRMDTAKADGREYVRVIDYKTGKKELDLNELYNGTQLQLMLYMMESLELVNRMRRNAAPESPDLPEAELLMAGLTAEGPAEPAGVFYYHVDDPIVDARTNGNPESSLLEDLRPAGLVRSDSGILQMMDKGLAAGVRSKVIPVKLTKEGIPDSHSNVTDRSGFQTLMTFTGNKIRTLGEEMTGGDIRVSPYLYEKQNGCAYCTYKSICGFDQRIPGYLYRDLGGKQSQDQLLAKMKEFNEEPENILGTKT